MLKVGDKVTPISDERVPLDCRGRVFTVEKVNPKKLKCSADDGGLGINFPKDLLAPATDENLAAGKTVSTPFVPREFFSVGEIVTLAKSWKDWGTDKPLVVLKDGGKRVNVTPLGGDDDKYLRVPPSGLVKRDLEWLAEALTA